MKNTKNIAFGLALASLVLFSGPSRALSVKTLTLSQIVDFSDIVFRGTVLDTSTQMDTYESGFLVKYYTFQVDECIKGSCDSKVTIKQIANEKMGLPEYQIAKSYVMFLPIASEETGLVAPVGIWQGAYSLTQDNGRLIVPSLIKNSRALKNLALTGSTKVPLSLLVSQTGDYESFKALIVETMKTGDAK